MRERDGFKIILEAEDNYDDGGWRWRVINPWGFTSAGWSGNLGGAFRSAKRAMRKLENIRSMAVDSGNPPTYEEGAR